MKPSSTRYSVDKTSCVWFAICVGLAFAGTGCESLQKKLIRKKKNVERPSPVINFLDYTHAMTPLDRYRKHYVLFDYWNGELLDALGQSSMNPKRAERASAEALQELQILQQLVQDELASRVTPAIEERTRIDRELKGRLYAPSQLIFMRRTLDTQTRQLYRELFWRKVEDRLREQMASPPVTDATAH